MPTSRTRQNKKNTQRVSKKNIGLKIFFLKAFRIFKIVFTISIVIITILFFRVLYTNNVFKKFFDDVPFLYSKAFNKNISALLLGDFMGIKDEYKKDFETLFREIGQKYEIPVIGEYPISHSKQKCTIPVGAYAKLKDGYLFIKDYLK